MSFCVNLENLLTHYVSEHKIKVIAFLCKSITFEACLIVSGVEGVLFPSPPPSFSH